MTSSPPAKVPSVLVRAWHPRTNVLETPVRLLGDGFNGRRARCRPSSSAATESESSRCEMPGRLIDSAFRVYDVEAGGFLSDQPLPIGVSAISDDGRFVLDQQLRLYTATGDLELDFSQLLPVDVRIPDHDPTALSFDSGAVAVVVWDATNARATATVVVYANGQVVKLSDSPERRRGAKSACAGSPGHPMDGICCNTRGTACGYGSWPRHDGGSARRQRVAREVLRRFRSLPDRRRPGDARRARSFAGHHVDLVDRREGRRVRSRRARVRPRFSRARRSRSRRHRRSMDGVRGRWVVGCGRCQRG